MTGPSREKVASRLVSKQESSNATAKIFKGKKSWSNRKNEEKEARIEREE